MNLGQESEFVEFKKTTSEMREGMASIAAILNKHGRGEIYFGVKNDGEVVGQDVSETTLRKLGQAVADSVRPPIYPTIEALDDGGRGYIRVAFSGFETPYACKGKYYIRVADADVEMSQEELSRMFLYARTRETPWDQWASARPVADVDEAELRSYVERGNSCGRIRFPYAGPENALSRLALIRNGRLTNAAEVLFCPSRDIGLKMGIFASHARTEILDMRQERGTLFQLVREAERYILLNTRRRFVIRGGGPREELPELPPAAVREALYNAFTHRDRLSGACVQVEIYSDSVEITNPGWFIEGQDPAAHLSGEDNSSLSRNMLIAQTLHKSGDIESFGTGIPRIREACEAAGIRVEYARTANGTKFIFHRNEAFEGKVPASSDKFRQVPISSDKLPASSDNFPTSSDKFRQVPISSDKLSDGIKAREELSVEERLACRLMAEKGPMRSAEIAAAAGLTQRGAQKLLARLVERGLVVVQGGAKRNRSYSLKDDSR